MTDAFFNGLKNHSDDFISKKSSIFLKNKKNDTINHFFGVK